MIPVFLDNTQSNALQPIIEVVPAGSNSHGQIVFPEYLFDNKIYKTTSAGKNLFKYNYESGIDIPDVYAQRIKYFLDQLSQQNKIIDRSKVSEVIYSKKPLLGIIERLVAEVTSIHGNEIDKIVMRVLNNEDDSQEYVNISFNMNESVSIRESIKIDDSFKMGKKWPTSSEGLTFNFL